MLNVEQRLRQEQLHFIEPNVTDAKRKILYISRNAMYISVVGEITPYFVSNVTINELMLETFYEETHNEFSIHSIESNLSIHLDADANKLHATITSSFTIDEVKDSNSNLCWRDIAQQLHKELFHHDIILIFSLATSNTFREQLLLLLFHTSIQVRSVVVLSDIVAESIGCGIFDGVVIHASPYYLCVGKVSEGNTVKYGNSKQGGLLMASLLLATRDNNNNNNNSNNNNKVNIDKVLSEDISIHEEIVKLFGFASYVYALERHLKRLEVAELLSSEASTRELFKIAKLKLTNENVSRYQVGTLERLLVQITENDSYSIIICGDAVKHEFIRDLCTSIILRCGTQVLSRENKTHHTREQRLKETYTHKRKRSEGSHNEYIRRNKEIDTHQERNEYINNMCRYTADIENSTRTDEERKSVTIAKINIEHEHNDNKHSPSKHINITNNINTHNNVNNIHTSCTIDRQITDVDEGESEASLTNDDDVDDDDDDDDGSNSSNSSDVTNISTDSDSSSSNENRSSLLQIQPLPFIHEENYVVEYLPLLGGSLVAQMSSHELKRLQITAMEVQESNGKAIHWKAAL